MGSSPKATPPTPPPPPPDPAKVEVDPQAVATAKTRVATEQARTGRTKLRIPLGGTDPAGSGIAIPL